MFAGIFVKICLYLQYQKCSFGYFYQSYLIKVSKYISLMFKKQGMYDPAYEHDACGVGLLANINGSKSHEIVEKGLQVLENMEHRGAEGADERTGDGAGIMVQIPHEFILLQGIPVPEKGRYGVAMVFLPKDESDQYFCIDVFKQEISKAELNLITTRDVPVNSDILGFLSRAAEPDIKQLFITSQHYMTQEELDRTLYLVRRRVENRIAQSDIASKDDFYVCSLSTRVVIYKGMLISRQLRQYYPDLLSPWFTSGLALVHSRFSTNTSPRWPLAQPFRFLGHNGEINTIRGNRSWMHARETVLDPGKLGGIKDLTPIVQEGMSDSASFDNVFEFFVESGMSIPHVLAMMVPESFNDKNPIPQDLKDFFEYHSIMMEPWDGPAALLFSDGKYAGGMLDRNGLRPCRYLITKDGMLMMASETGVLSFDGSEIAEKGRLQPGKILLVDLETGKITYDAEVKSELAKEHPYGEWLTKNRIYLDNLTSGRKAPTMVEDHMTVMTAFGYSQEDISKLIVPMAQNAQEPTWSMGNDTPLAAFSNQPQRLFAYFRQQFAQVTNPPIDPIREKLVMSLDGYVGSIDSNLLEPNPDLCKMVKLSNPILTNKQFDLLCNIAYKGFRAVKAPMLFAVKDGAEGMKAAVENMCKMAEEAVDSGADYIILSDRGVNAEMAPVPSLLATSAVHTYLIERHKRCQIGLIVESAEPREVMHFALLMGFGASAINPYLAFSAIQDQINQHEIALDYDTAVNHYITAISKGLLKIMSKMGISTLMSYKGARIFEVAGLDQDVMNAYFGGADSKITGVGLAEIAEEVLKPHQKAYSVTANNAILPNYGSYAYRKDGEKHAWNPESISTLQIATRLGSYKKYKEFAKVVNEREEPMFVRDFMTFKKADVPTPMEEVEPVESIMHRFATGAMSFGAISKEAHEALAIAMNTIGGRSNTGEGGEPSERFYIKEGEPNVRSAIKQVASGRFGVTTEYLVNADEIQIKIAQGAKPGEGGQLPGFKVNEVIAKARHSMPGITLVSPPPHHDIYSIEDLAQLIFDLKNVNPKADISVKLVSESGIGTIAAGVAKAKADRIIISGADGGTGASPASSTKHAGMSPEIGLAETQQTLIINRLRGQVKIQTDGQMKTGRDAMIMALLGAEEYAFATAALIVLGCVMMRKCHMNTCPVGVATQDPKLRERFRGRSEYVINYFKFIAEEMREYLSYMGMKSMDDVIGRTDLIVTRNFDTNSKTKKICVDRLLYVPEEAKETAIRCVKPQHHNIDSVKDVNILKVAAPAISSKMPIQLSYSICNTDRAVGAMLSGEVAKKYGAEGLPADTLTISFKGSAGQSFGAFLTKGVSFKLQGDANDYLGKALSGGKISVIPPTGTSFAADENIICGNTLLYGATSGEVYINGRVGERFAVRNSGATAVIEGAGDHCCEYMTGGVVAVLGPVGRNFAAGMSAGVAYIYDPDHNFDYFCNMEMVELTLVEEIYDLKELRSLIERHYAATGSAKAKRLLDNWMEEVGNFIKVTPIEYKRVLMEKRLRELEAKQAHLTHQE